MKFSHGSTCGGAERPACGQSQALEKEYLHLRLLLHEAQAALRQSPHDAALQEKIQDLRKRQAELESRSRFADDYPPEFALEAAPHG